MDSGSSTVLVAICGLDKQFPGTHALNDVTFDIHCNTVHCIIGENGSGKSTMIKILTGALERTRGEILFEGRPYAPKSVREAMALGVPVAAVHTTRLYAGLDRLLPHKDAIEQHLKQRLGELFDLKYDLLLYDVTSTYFEGQALRNPQAKRGHSHW